MPLIKMERYILQQRIEIVKIHYKNGEKFAETVRKVKSFPGNREAPSRPAIVKLVQNIELLGQVSDVKNRTRARRVRTPANITSVAHSVEKNLGLSIPRRSLELGISQTTLHRILSPELEDMNVDDVYFQKDGATCHTSGETIGLLREKFPGRVISRNGDYNWDYVKDKVYTDAPQLIQELKEKIRAVEF